MNASSSFEQAVALDPSVPGGFANLNAARKQLFYPTSSPFAVHTILFGFGVSLLYFWRKMY